MLSQTEKAFAPFVAVGVLSLLILIYKLSLFFLPYLRSGSLVKRYNPNGGAWALVTGSSDGIGQAIAHELCSKGFNIILHGRNPAKLSTVQSQLSASFPDTQFRTFIADAAAPTQTSSTAITNLVTSIKDLNLTVLVNNVGGTSNLETDFTAFTDHTTKQIDDMISINMTFTTHLTHALLPLLSQHQPGLILNTGSGGQGGLPYLSVYAPTKAYLSSWGNALSIEMESEGVDVEVMTVLSGNTQSGQDRRAATLFRPTSKTFAQAALAKVGCGRSIVTGYFWHGVLAASMDLFPAWALRMGSIAGLKPLKGKDLDS